MANVKISELPAATTPLSDSNTIPVVQSGTTKQAALSSIGFLQTGTGATLRTAKAKMADIVSVKDFGAVGNGTTDDTTAVQAAINAGGSIYFPPGTYKLSSQITYTMPTTSSSITIFGAGPGISKLVWAAGGGLQINYLGQFNTAHVRDLEFLTTSANVGVGLNLNQQAASIPNPANTAISDVTNCVFRGSDGYAGVYYWSVGVQCQGVSFVNFYGVDVTGFNTIGGIGVLMQGTATVIPVIYKFQSCKFNYVTYGISYGNYVQGVSVNQCEFTGGQYGIISLASLSGLDLLSVTGSQFDVSIAGILTNTFIPGTQITNCFFIVSSNCVGINLNQAGLYNIIGNEFHPDGTPTNAIGIAIGTTVSSYPGVITGNTIFGMSNSGIYLAAGSTAVNVQSNVYLTNGTNITNLGTSNTLGGGST